MNNFDFNHGFDASTVGTIFGVAAEHAAIAFAAALIGGTIGAIYVEIRDE